jgi:hypothetical protein
MNTSPVAERNFFGLFELDDAGTVLYSKAESDTNADKEGVNLAGHNVFKEVLACENGEELQRRINRFIAGEAQSDNFLFHCRNNNGMAPVRVLRTRIRERSNGEKMKSILVHIRKS